MGVARAQTGLHIYRVRCYICVSTSIPDIVFSRPFRKVIIVLPIYHSDRFSHRFTNGALVRYLQSRNSQPSRRASLHLYFVFFFLIKCVYYAHICTLCFEIYFYTTICTGKKERGPRNLTRCTHVHAARSRKRNKKISGPIKQS